MVEDSKCLPVRSGFQGKEKEILVWTYFDLRFSLTELIIVLCSVTFSSPWSGCRETPSSLSDLLVLSGSSSLLLPQISLFTPRLQQIGAWRVNSVQTHTLANWTQNFKERDGVVLGTSPWQLAVLPLASMSVCLVNLLKFSFEARRRAEALIPRVDKFFLYFFYNRKRPFILLYGECLPSIICSSVYLTFVFYFIISVNWVGFLK